MGPAGGSTPRVGEHATPQQRRFDMLSPAAKQVRVVFRRGEESRGWRRRFGKKFEWSGGSAGWKPLEVALQACVSFLIYKSSLSLCSC